MNLIELKAQVALGEDSRRQFKRDVITSTTRGGDAGRTVLSTDKASPTLRLVGKCHVKGSAPHRRTAPGWTAIAWSKGCRQPGSAAPAAAP